MKSDSLIRYYVLVRGQATSEKECNETWLHNPLPLNVLQ